MKIAFVEPIQPESMVAQNPDGQRFVQQVRKYLPIWRTPNLGLLTVAGMVPEDWDMEYIHSVVHQIDYGRKYNVVAISGMTPQAEDVYDISRKFRRRGAYVVVGGIHATVVPEETAQYADTIITGEAENTFPAFIEDFQNGTPQPVYRSQGEVEMSRSPIPRFDILKANYTNYPIQTTRGCPHNCNFCACTRIFGSKYRHKEVEQVIEEVKFLQTVKPNPFVLFVDDNMLVNRTFSTALLEKLIPLNIRWQALSDVAVAKNKEFLHLLFKAGCRELFIGFESVTPEALKGINKNQWKAKRIKDYREAVRNIQEQGIRVFGAFILGFDSDTEEDFERIRDFVIQNKILAQFTVLTPLPGTSLYDEMEQAGRLLKDKTWKHYTFLDCVMSHPTFTPSQLEKNVAELFLATFSRENYARVSRNHINNLAALKDWTDRPFSSKAGRT